MILYKYYGFQGGEKAIQSQLLGFRTPCYFNDPFELSGLSNAAGYVKIKVLLDFLGELGVLCLTKSPLNPLMWAHYSDQHKGFVVGYDVSGEYLSDPGFNVITAMNGNVFYTSRKENSELSNDDRESFMRELLHCVMERDSDPNFDIPLLKKVFLQKHICWSYEEEVRVVKRLFTYAQTVAGFSEHPYNRFTKITEPIPGQPGHIQEVEGCEGLFLSSVKTPIKEVYLGLRCEMSHLSSTTKSILSAVPKVYQVQMADDSWELTVAPVSTTLI